MAMDTPLSTDPITTPPPPPPPPTTSHLENLEMEDGIGTLPAAPARLVLNGLEPPGALHEFIGWMKETMFPINAHMFKNRPAASCARSVLPGLFPILRWCRAYKATKFKNDFMAGLTLASLSIPQSIGYANLAKLDPQLGFLVDLLSHAAIVGFMGGAAIVIGLQQLKGLLGIAHFTRKTDIISVLQSVWKSHHTWNAQNFLLGSSFLIFLLIARFVGKKKKKVFWIPAIAPLLSVILSTLFVFLTRADKHGVQIVAHIKGGLNPSSLHQLQFKGPHVGEAARVGLIIAGVALTEAIAVGRSFASIRGYHLDGNKEMVAMGFMNMAGSLTSWSFSRTAVNFSAGCETVVSNIVMAVTVLGSLVLFTKLLYFTPITILASIILSALPGLIDLNEAYKIWKVDKLDFLACIAAFFGVLFASVEIGLLTASALPYVVSPTSYETVPTNDGQVSISFLKIIVSSIKPGTEVLGRLPGTNVIIRWVTLGEEEELGESGDIDQKDRIQVLILDLSKLMNIDTSGIIALEELHKRLISRGIELALANPSWSVIHKLKLVKFVEKIGGRVFFTVNEAVNACIGSKMLCLMC
ncbi:hypothetical protein Scep_018614 [Stephania cephalantha]|uniref:STAS domain-containing protein n=1 Tax=Stephania cephalantha TaxID=152367 RepID=A0AAP0I9E5_9MAGN